MDVTLGDTSHNTYALESKAGSTSDKAIFFRKENLHEVSNPAYAGSCDPELLFYAVQRSYVVSDGGDFRMANGSCLWVDDPTNASAGGGSSVSAGPCTEPQGQWRWEPHNSSSKRGDIVWSGASAAAAAGAASAGSLCLSSGVKVSSSA